MNSMSFIIRCNSRFILLLAISLFLFACDKQETQQDETQKPIPEGGEEGKASNWPAGYTGGGVNGFTIYVLINENMSTQVWVGLNFWPEYEDCENLECEIQKNGFVLKDPSTKEVHYTAIAKEGGTWDTHTSLPFNATISWSHSPGPHWDENAEKLGWGREVSIHLNVID